MRSIHILFFLALAAGGCSKAAPAKTTPAVADPVPMGETAPAASSKAPESARAVLSAYERVRASLAADDFTSVPDAARALETSAKAAASANAHFSAIATSSSALVSAADLKAARASFGEVSEHLVALLATDKALAAGQHVFECPMVKGYNKWVQPSENLENPYMGKRMLTCGGESSWTD